MSETGGLVRTDHYRHGQPEKLGILLVALGSPDSPAPGALKRYLRQFLGDRRVIEMSKLPKWLLLNLIILPRRSHVAAANYRKIWRKEGAPLLLFSYSQQNKLHQTLIKDYPFVTVGLGMSYGKPAISQALLKLKEEGVTRLLIFPLYPQYASATVGSVFESVTEELRRWRWIPDTRFIHSYHDHPEFIKVLADSVRASRRPKDKNSLLLFSFHGIPLASLGQGDPYHCHCHKTARLVAAELKLRESDYRVTFQSRFGKQPWLQPYTDETLAALPAKGIKDLRVICPGFSSDCLETIEEIDRENREVFIKAGGQHYDYIPCLNDTPNHIAMMASLAEENCSDWFKRLGQINKAEHRNLSKDEYLKHKNANPTLGR